MSQAKGAKPIGCGLDSAEDRDLLILAAKAFTTLEAEPSFEAKCRVWEGEGYGDYYGAIHGQARTLHGRILRPAPQRATRFPPAAPSTNPSSLSPQIMLLFEGADPPPEGTEPSEALCLHGCKAEPVEGDEDGPELSLADSGGEIFSLCFADEAERDEFKEVAIGAARTRTHPARLGSPPIDRATHGP